jgi:hypothetical protein
LLNRWVLFFCLTIFLSVLSSACYSDPLQGKNIALGAHYSFAPPAKYEFTRDSTDAVKLTDGKFAFGYFWTDRVRTVGWHRSGTIRIDIDLGREYEVHRITFHSARGSHAGVSFPLRVDFYISPDAERYKYAGDVLQGQDVTDGPYKVEKFISSEINTAGRYVTLFIVPQGEYTFADEVEVFGAEKGGGTQHEYPLGSKLIGAHHDNIVRVARQMASLKKMRELLVGEWHSWGGATAAAKSNLRTKFENLENKLNAAGNIPDSGNLQAFEDSLFAVHAQLLGARFNQQVVIWDGNPWAVFTPVDSPRPEELLKKELVLDVMRGGTTSDAIGIANSSTGLQKVHVAVQFGPEIGKPPYVTIREARPVVLADAGVKADPLVAIADGGILLKSGESRQLWITVKGNSDPGTYLAQLTVSLPGTGSPVIVIPLRFKVWSAKFPARQTVRVNTWSYLNWRPIKDIQRLAIDDLRAHHVNVFVLHPSQIPWPGRGINASGLGGAPDFTAFDRIIQLHQGAEKYLFYLAFNNDHFVRLIGNEKFMSSEWNDLFKKWIAVWSAHLNTLGIKFEQFAFYPYDEPKNEAEAKVLSSVSGLIKEVDKRLQVYTTIGKLNGLNNYSIEELKKYVDIFQVNELDLGNTRLSMLKNPGKEIWCYSGGGKKADPFRQYRLQAWKAFKYGATGIGFWAYADTGSTGTAWDDSDGNRPDYAVIYEGENGIVSSKRWEAWREGVEDYELLLQAKKKLKPGKEAVEFAQRITSVLEYPDDHVHFKETRRFLLDIASR